ncbi:hypothetical protein IT408_00870 [Candidatus Uhrbacteria bacterium]|nr:hypothetical protein [Candidatus Uhrbacteria bacterium]
MPYTKEFLEEMASAQDTFVWESPLWEAHPRSSRWYWWMALVVVLFFGYALFTANYLFAFIVILTGIILVLAGNEAPRRGLVQIGHNGIVYDGTFYLYEKIHDFALVYQPPELKLLYIQPKNALKPRLRIELEDQDPILLRNHLKTYIDENTVLRGEHYSDIFARLLKL